jgi:hypothetical protein
MIGLLPRPGHHHDDTTCRDGDDGHESVPSHISVDFVFIAPGLPVHHIFSALTVDDSSLVLP